jgi:hypothetical protein
MPTGFASARKAIKDQKAKRGSGAFFKLPDDGDTAIVRFLEDDISWAYVHEVPVEGRKWPDNVVCLDQDEEGIDCPGCDAELKRKIQAYANVIWHDAPELKRNKEGKLVKDDDGDVVPTGKTAAQVALWTFGPQLLEELDEINESFKGLTSRRFKVKRKGLKLDTKYDIKPEDPDSGRQDFTEKETELAAKKTDLKAKISPPSYEDFQKKMRGEKTSSDDDGGSKSGSDAAKSAARRNPFMRK